MISCIVPVYNCKEYLRECLESIINQTYTDFEVLLIDDGSTDGSDEICRIYTEIDNRIRYYRKENGGAASARNLGLEKAAGEFISFVDSDDVISSDYFEKMLETAIKTNVDMVVSSVDKGYSSNGKILPDALWKREEYIKKALTEFEHIAVYSLWTKLLRKSVIEKSQLRMPEEYRLSEDQIFIIKLMGIVDTIATVSYSGYYYRDNQSSLTHNRLDPEVLNNIIDAEKMVCRETERVMLGITNEVLYIRWLENKKKNALFAMDAYISKCSVGYGEKWNMRKKLFGYIEPDSIALQKVTWGGLRYSLKKKNVAILSVWLFLMRCKQGIRRC